MHYIEQSQGEVRDTEAGLQLLAEYRPIILTICNMCMRKNPMRAVRLSVFSLLRKKIDFRSDLLTFIKKSTLGFAIIRS